MTAPAADATPAPHPWRDMLRGIDWCQLWYPGPRRRFTPDELARAGGAPPGATFWLVTSLNALWLSIEALLVAPAHVRAVVSLELLLSLAVVALGVKLLWFCPTRRRLLACNMTGALVSGAIAIGIKHGLHGLDTVTRLWLISSMQVTIGLGALMLWTLTLYRAHQIEGRLNELAERDEALALARRLSAAQLQPHFLFNTLASIQHWVDTGNAKAGPTLRSLTDYLRALLPMFEHALHPLADELDAMRRYLEVMQTRLGERLRYRFDLDGSDAPLPPGIGLTLLENAIEHGVQPSLRGADVLVRTRRVGDAVQLDVLDTGPGFSPPLAEGVGLRNCRQRLQQAFGERAALAVQSRADALGCCASVTLPFTLPSHPVHR